VPSYRGSAFGERDNQPFKYTGVLIALATFPRDRAVSQLRHDRADNGEEQKDASHPNGELEQRLLNSAPGPIDRTRIAPESAAEG